MQIFWWNVWCRTTDKEIIIFKNRFSLFNLRHQKTQFLQENCLNAQNSFCHNLIKIGWIFLGQDFNGNKLLPFFVTFYDCDPICWSFIGSIENMRNCRKSFELLWLRAISFNLWIRKFWNRWFIQFRSHLSNSKKP